MSLNKFIGIGNLTRNAEIREVGQNKVARFAIAMNEKFRKQDGSMGESTEFLEVELWNQVGVYPYLQKGQLVYVEGSIKTEKWTGNDGVEKTTIKLRALSVQLLGAKPQSAAPAQQMSNRAPAPNPASYTTTPGYGYSQPGVPPTPPLPGGPYPPMQQTPPPTPVMFTPQPQQNDLPF